MEMLEENMD